MSGFAIFSIIDHPPLLQAATRTVYFVASEQEARAQATVDRVMSNVYFDIYLHASFVFCEGREDTGVLFLTLTRQYGSHPAKAGAADEACLLVVLVLLHS